MRRRSQLIPWRAAGRVSEQLETGDDVVRETGWVFNNAVGDHLTLADFVASGDDEVPAYLETFGVRGAENQEQTLVEIGAGIGRMTCAFTREFGQVVACDVDAGFLERCYETVGRFGRVDRLRTSHVADGRTLDLGPDIADVAFSYITLQHCDVDDALDLSQEAVRVTKPGGRILLNYRAPAGSDLVVLPVGKLVRTTFRLPVVGGRLAKNRTVTRLGWQVSRLHPDAVTGPLRPYLTDIEVWTHPTSRLESADGEHRQFDGINKNHWWLVATVV